MKHASLYDQVRCDIIKQTDQEVFGAMFDGEVLKFEDHNCTDCGEICGTCGGVRRCRCDELLCGRCGEHFAYPGKCRMDVIEDVTST